MFKRPEVEFRCWGCCQENCRFSSGCTCSCHTEESRVSNVPDLTSYSAAELKNAAKIVQEKEKALNKKNKIGEIKKNEKQLKSLQKQLKSLKGK